MASPPADQQPSSPSARRWWRVILVGCLLAAVVVSALYRQLRPRDLPDSRVLLSSIAGGDAPIDVILQPIWSEMRGHAEGALKPEARAVRLGAALAELELRHGRSDSSTGAVAEQVVALLRTFPGSDDAVRAIQSLGTSVNDRALQSATALAEQAAGRRAVRLGAWLRSARFAAATADSTVFDRAVIRSVSRAVITYDSRPETEYAARQFEDIARERPHNWTALGTAVDELIRLLGTR